MQTRRGGFKENKELATAEVIRRWELTKKKTLLDDDMTIANDQVGNMVQEIQHNGWTLVLVDQQNHYYPFRSKLSRCQHRRLSQASAMSRKDLAAEPLKLPLKCHKVCSK